MIKIIQRKRHRSAVQIREVVGRYRASGLSRAEFVNREGICLATLSRYLKSESGLASPAGAAAPRFLEIEHGGVVPGAAGRRDVYRICLPGGMELEVPSGYSKIEVAGLLEVITSAKGAW